MHDFIHNTSLGVILTGVGLSIVSGWYDIVTNWENLSIAAATWPVLITAGIIALVANLLLKK